MQIEITAVEVISAGIGAIIGYKLKVQIASAIIAIKKALANVLTVK